jgi:hypothetical protein
MSIRTCKTCDHMVVDNQVPFCPMCRIAELEAGILVVSTTKGESNASVSNARDATGGAASEEVRGPNPLVDVADPAGPGPVRRPLNQRSNDARVCGHLLPSEGFCQVRNCTEHCTPKQALDGLFNAAVGGIGGTKAAALFNVVSAALQRPETAATLDEHTVEHRTIAAVVEWLRTTARAGGVLISISSSQDIARLADELVRGAWREVVPTGSTPR